MQQDPRADDLELVGELGADEAVIEGHGDRSELERRQERDHPLDRVDPEDRDAIAGAHPETRESSSHLCHEPGEITIGELFVAGAQRQPAGSLRGVCGERVRNGRELWEWGLRGRHQLPSVR